MTQLASAIYEGTIRHRRFAVRDHAFTYRLALAYIDLDELPGLLGGRLTRRAPGLVRFRRADYLGDGRLALGDAVRDLVGARTGVRPEGPVRVLTQLRSFGHCFNPVSFYYCFSGSGLSASAPGDRVEAIVAEVNNTPWGERHAYVLPRGGSSGAVLQGEFAKRLHVSPFMGMDQRYVWRAATPGETLSLHIENREGAQRTFDATLALERRPLTRTNLRRVTARYPAATVRVLALIYANAVALWLKGVPVHARPQAVA